MLEIIWDFICEIGLESLTNKIKGVKNSNEIKRRLKDFIEKKQELFENVGFDEEIDFQGLAEYISKQLPDKIDSYIYSKSEDQRKGIADTIVAKAIDHAKPNTIQGEKYVENLIFQCIQLLHDFYVITFLDSKTTLAIAEVSQVVGKDGDKTREAITQLHTKIDSKEDIYWGRRIDMMKAVNSLKLPDYTRAEIPRTVHPNNPEIDVNEFDVLFNNDSIKNNYRLLQDKIKAMEGLVYELKEFHRYFRESDGEGGWLYPVWDEIIKKEDTLIRSNYEEEVEKDFEEFCKKHEVTTFIVEINEPVTYNYYIITKNMDQMQQEFNILKSELVNQIKRYLCR